MGSLHVVHSLRAPDFSFDGSREILDLRDRGTAPFTYVTGLTDEQISAIDDHIRELERLRVELSRLHRAGL